MSVQPTSDQSGTPVMAEKTNGHAEGNADTLNAALNNAEANDAPQEQQKTFTQAEVDQIFAKRLQKAVKAELKKLAGDEQEKPDLSELQRKLEASEQKTRDYETNAQILDYLSDSRHKLSPRPESLKTIQKLVRLEIEHSEDGEITNLKEAIEKVKLEAPALFSNPAPTVNANAGRELRASVGNNMNQLIREIARSR